MSDLEPTTVQQARRAYERACVEAHDAWERHGDDSRTFGWLQQATFKKQALQQVQAAAAKASEDNDILRAIDNVLHTTDGPYDKAGRILQHLSAAGFSISRSKPHAP